MMATMQKKLERTIQQNAVLVLPPDEVESLLSAVSGTLEMFNLSSNKEKFKEQRTLLENVQYSLRNYDILEKMLLEKLATLEHEQWKDWIKYDQKVKSMLDSRKKLDIIQGWFRKLELDFNELSRKEQESDKKYARLVIKVLKGASPAKKS